MRLDDSCAAGGLDGSCAADALGNLCVAEALGDDMPGGSVTFPVVERFLSA